MGVHTFPKRICPKVNAYIGKNNMKSPRDLNRLDLIQTLVKDNRLNLVL